ncbi:UvrD-helicase domain-containing protein [Caedibacter taeniospiralis]|jgi:ATP-dependent exoDNAse (exonuclease V) beta subunit|uniref:UvrD-helicase domain-containing protein n=1 Tax=Caedibacter taeniospiralis TaxID=28907 RepID=UPI0037C0BCD3
MIPDDAHARKQALDYRQSFIVQAPAGSGKTETLTQRYLNLLAHVDAPEEIIALTFTNKAANEMHHRIYQALMDAKSTRTSDESHKKLTLELAQAALKQSQLKHWHILNNPKRLRITTIDAFCQLLSKQLVFETDEAFSAEVTDSPELLYEKAIDQLIADTTDTSPYYQDFYQLLLHLDNNISNVKQLFTNLLSTREQWLPILLQSELPYQNGTHTRSTIESGFLALFRALCQKATHLLCLDQKTYSERLGQIMAFCDQTDSNQSVDEDLASSFENNYNHPFFWQRLIKLLFTSELQFRKTYNAKQGLPAKDPTAEAHKKWLLTYIEQFSDEDKLKIYDVISELVFYEKLIFDDSEWQILKAITQISLRLVQYLKLVFKQQGLLDFNEVSLQALSALGNEDSPTELMLYLDHQIRHLLIDEFQDTSILQFKLLQMLTLEWRPDDGKTLFVVGDPMQSIYRFRQAEVNQFLEVKSQGINQIKPKFLQLHCNFRSQKSIVDWVNKSFSQIFPAEDDMNYGGISYAYASTLSEINDQEAVGLSLFSDDQDEADYVAHEIKHYLQKHPVHHIAILARTRTQLKTMIPILKAHQIKLVENEIETFYRQPIVVDLVSLAAILTNPEQEIYWMSLLQSSLFGFSLNELDRVKKTSICEHEDFSFCSQLFTYLDHNRGYAHQQKAYYFLQWLVDMPFIGLRGSLIDRLSILWQKLDGMNIHAAQKSLYTSFLALLDGHLTPDKTSIANMDCLIDTLKRKYISIPSQAQVSIMTIHKAKGLEFDFVILPQLDKGSRVDESPLFLHESVRLTDHKVHLLLSPIKHSWDRSAPALYRVIQNMQRKRAAYEQQRLLYVAITRAKSKLLLTAITGNDRDQPAAKSNSLLALLQPLNLPWNAAAHQDKSNRLSQDKAERLACYKPIKQVSHYSISSTDIFPSMLLQDELNHPDMNELIISEDRQMGSAFHQLFNYLCRNPGHIGDWQAYFSLCAHEYALSGTLKIKALNHARLAVEHTQQHYPWIFSATGMSEQAMLSLNFDKLKKNIADRIIVDNSQYHIVDYKFTSPVVGETLEDFLKVQEAHYSEQLKTYQTLLATHLQINKTHIKVSLYFPLIPCIHSL